MSGSESASNREVIRLRFTIHQARELPKPSGKYFVTLETRAGHIDRTDKKQHGASIAWNKEFLCELKVTNPIISINVFRVGRFRGKEELVAIALPDVSSCLPPSTTDIFNKDCPLLSPTPSTHPLLGKATIVYSCILEGRELTTRAMKEMVQGVPKMTTPGLTGPATALSVTTSDVAQTIIGILKKIERLGEVISEVHPYAKLAWTVLNAAWSAVTGQMDLDDRIRDLWETVNDILDLVDQLGNLKDDLLYQKTVEAILKQIYEYVLFVRWYADKGFGGRLARDTISDKAKEAIENFEKAFQGLRRSFKDRILLGDTKQTYRLVALTEHIGKMAESQRLDSLPGASLPSVGYDKQKACLPGTRKELIENIEQWIHTANESNRILWLCGPAGTGKSSVANSVAERMDSLDRLAASFRFDRNQADRTPTVLIGNLCRQVARFNDSLKGAILEALERHGTGWPCATQAEKLFVGPISKVDIIGPIVIVIDALDESGNDEVVDGATGRKELVLAIIKEFVKLPSSVKLLITSREEGCIPAYMLPVCRRLPIIETLNVEEDITTFIEHRIDEIRALRERKPSWPGDQSIQGLIRYAEGLFICAAVSCNFIQDGPNPDSRLKEVLEPSRPVQFSALDKLYLTVVEHSLRSTGTNREAELEKNDWRRVVGTIAVVGTPLTVDEMDALLQLPTDSLQTTRDVTARLLPLLKDDKENKTVQFLHKSVFDFLTTQKNHIPPVWYSIDTLVWHQSMAIDCLAYMNEHLRLDMSWISPSESSSPPPESCNASALCYACHHFSDHLSLALDPASCANELRSFLRTHLLHWFEVMARLQVIYRAEESIKLLSDSLTAKLHSEQDGNVEDAKVDDIFKILRDGLSFLRNFRGVAVLSPMDIYRSGIPMSPKDSRIYELYSSCMKLPRVISSAHLWSRSLCVFEGHTSSVSCVAFSRDGKIASGSWDNTLRLWDAEKGEAIGSALEGHSSPVTSAVFSPDGKKVASGSRDNTVRLWDAEKGEAIGSALEGHRSSVMSVVFSPDGKKVASGSRDNTVRLWDAEKGEAIGSALEGHRDSVTSVVFSPDGKKVASGSRDNTVRLWDAEKGEAIGSALEGHRDWVTTVVFSPDGMKVASGSNDNTVRLWDAEKGEAIGSTLEEHLSLSSRLTINAMGFLVTNTGAQLIWIPPHLRGYCIAYMGSTLVIGGDSGAVTFISDLK